jgi:hypothetical protein
MCSTAALGFHGGSDGVLLHFAVVGASSEKQSNKIKIKFL